MAEHKEFEIKFEFKRASLPRLQQMPLIHGLNPQRPSTEVSVYFDTDRHTLRKKGLTLRVRRIGDRYVQTIKKTGNLAPFERGEWEAEIEGEEPVLSIANHTELETLLDEKLGRQLKPLFETRVRRTTYSLTRNSDAIALTIDRGTIKAESGTVPLCEIELELRRGSREQLFEIARELAHALPLQLTVKSKADRGYELIDGMQNAPVKSTPIDLAIGTTSREAFKIIGLSCLNQMIANYQPVIQGNPEGVHQMRVGLRRLRAGMSVFSPLLYDRQAAAIKAELKWLGGALGPARELDVLVQRVVVPVEHGHIGWEGIPSLSRELAAKRDTALTRAQNAITSERFRALTLSVVAWLEIGQWTNPPDDLVRERGNIAIEVFAVEHLSRYLRKVRKRGKTLLQLDPMRRHRLRIQVKKLRYAVEFFASLFSDKRLLRRREKFLPVLERLQDCLGDLNDIAVNEARMTEIGIRHRQSNPKRVFAAGLLTGREDARLEVVAEAATAAYERLIKVKPFWK